MTWSILAVDDDNEMRSLLRLMLERKGFCVSEAANGEDALKEVFDSPPHLVLMDAMMPGINGFTACKIIRRTESTAHIPVVMFSAMASKESKEKGHQSGANAYLTKPVSWPLLFETIERILEDFNIG